MHRSPNTGSGQHPGPAALETSPPWPIDETDGTATANEAVVRAVCASRCTIKVDVYRQMESIRASALRHNLGTGVHAALIHQSGWFIFWTEGPLEAVRTVLHRAKADRRHKEMRILHQSRGKRYLATPWSMAMAPDTESTEALKLRADILSNEIKRGRQYSPTSVIRRLTKPMRLSLSNTLEDPDVFLRVGVCATDAESAFGLVRWLARKEAVHSEKLRVSGSHDMDSGMEYVDFIDRGAPCRVIALPRRGFGNGLRQALLADWPLLVIVLSGQDKLDDALVDRISNVCTWLPNAPTLLGIAPDSRTQLRQLNRALARNVDYVHAGIVAGEDPRAIWRAVRPWADRLEPGRTTTWSTLDPVVTAF